MKTKMLAVLVLFLACACGRFENSPAVPGAEVPSAPVGTALDGGDVIRNGDSTDFGPYTATPYTDSNADDLKKVLKDEKVLKRYRGFKERNSEERVI